MSWAARMKYRAIAFLKISYSLFAKKIVEVQAIITIGKNIIFAPCAIKPINTLAITKAIEY